MTSTLHFRIYRGEGTRTRVAYWADDLPREFIYADHVPARALDKLVNGANARKTPAGRQHFMSRTLGYRSGEYTDFMCVSLMRKKIAKLGTAARKEHRQKLSGGYKRKTQRPNDRTPDTIVFGTLSTTKQRLLKCLDSKNEWDTETRASVRQQIDKFSKWVVTIQAKI